MDNHDFILTVIIVVLFALNCYMIAVAYKQIFKKGDRDE